MAYDKSSSGCTPITAKIKRTTQGGVVQPLLNMGAPVKIKMSSPAKNAANRAKANESRVKARLAAGAAKEGAKKALELKKAKELASKEFISNKRGRKVKNPAYQAQTIQPVKDTKSSKSSGASMTPYSVKDGKGIIHGPKVSYDMAYKNRGAAYKDMNKADYIKEAKRQTKSFTSTGKWDAQRKKQKVASTISSKPAKTVSIETKKPTADVNISVKPASKVTNKKAAKKATNKTQRAARVRQKGIDALASGNSAKALRLKRREARINKRAEKQAAKAIEPKKDKKPKRAAKGSRAATLRK